MFLAYTKLWAELRRVLVTGCTVSRYDQFEISPETIEQELRLAVCEHRLKNIIIRSKYDASTRHPVIHAISYIESTVTA